MSCFSEIDVTSSHSPDRSVSRCLFPNPTPQTPIDKYLDQLLIYKSIQKNTEILNTTERFVISLRESGKVKQLTPEQKGSLLAMGFNKDAAKVLTLVALCQQQPESASTLNCLSIAFGILQNTSVRIHETLSKTLNQACQKANIDVSRLKISGKFLTHFPEAAYEDPIEYLPQVLAYFRAPENPTNKIEQEQLAEEMLNRLGASSLLHFSNTGKGRLPKETIETLTTHGTPIYYLGLISLVASAYVKEYFNNPSLASQLMGVAKASILREENELPEELFTHFRNKMNIYVKFFDIQIPEKCNIDIPNY